MVFADGARYLSGEGEPDITIVFRTRAAERRTLLFGYVGLFEAHFDGDVDIAGTRAVSRLKRTAYSSSYRYRAIPLLLARRKFLEWRDDNRDFAKAKDRRFLYAPARP